MRSSHKAVVVADDRGLKTSERTFGLVMAAAFAALGATNYLHAGSIWPALLCIAGVLCAAGLIWPRVLRPFNVLWYKLGLLLHMVFTPIVMGLIFFTAVTATGVAMRMLGKNLLRLKRPEGLDSYWIVRTPPGPEPRSLKNQF